MKTGIAKRVMSFVLSFCLLLSTVTITAFAATNWSPSEKTHIYVDADSVSAIASLNKEANSFRAEYAEKLNVTLPVTFGSIADAGSTDIILTYDRTIPEQGFKVSISGSQLTIAASDDDGIFYGYRYVIKQMLQNGSVSAASETPSVLERSISLDNGRKYYTVEWIKELIREMSWANMNTLVMHFSEEMGLGLESKTYSWLNGRDGTLCTQTTLAADYDNRYLTQEQFQDIAAYAEAYHIDLVPAMDSPGHLNYLVKTFNDKVKDEGSYSFNYNGHEYMASYSNGSYSFFVDGTTVTTSMTKIYGIGNYLYNEKTGQNQIVQGSLNKNYSRGIDVSNPVAVAFVQSLLEEYCDLFRSVGATKIDIGGDELLGWGSSLSGTDIPSGKWNQLDHWKAYAQDRAQAEGKSNYKQAVAYDAFLYYMNDLTALVRSKGFTSVRMWNDDVLRADANWNEVVTLDTNIDIWYWSPNTQTVTTYIDNGYNVYNMYNQYCYFAMTAGYAAGTSYADANAETIFNEWTPYEFGTTDAITTDQKAAVLGGAFGIWSDNPSLWDEDEVMDKILPIFRATATKSWNANAKSSMNYTQYQTMWTRIGDSTTVDRANVSSEILDVSALRIAVKDAANVNGADHDETSYNAYVAAVAEGQNILDYGATSQEQIDNAVLAIQNAKAALTTDKDLLENAIAESESISADGYTADSYAAYTEAVEAGRQVLTDENATQREIVAACNAIATAKANLTVDKSALQKVLDETPDPDEDEFSRYANYPEDLAIAQDIYKKALTDAQAVLDNPAATKEEVAAALEAFRNAKGFFFVDYTGLEAAVKLADEIEANEELYVPIYYKDYVELVNEARTYYLAENSYPFHQTTVDAMKDNLLAAHDKMVTEYRIDVMAKELVLAVNQFYVDLIEHRKNPYLTESWLMYATCAIGGANILKSGDYDRNITVFYATMINYYRVGAKTPRESDYASQRKELINSAAFGSKTVLSGATVRMSVTTPLSEGVTSVQIVDENGSHVPCTITVAPVNRRQPTVRTLYVDIPMNYEPGTYTFTVYAYDPTTVEADLIKLCGDPVECTITVK